MHHSAVAGLDLRRPDPFAFRETGVDQEMLVGVVARGDVEVFTDINDDIRLAQPPALTKYRRRRQIARIALRGAGLHPGLDGLYVGLREPGVVAKVSKLRI